MIDLDGALTDLAEHLDCPSGARLSDNVRERLAAPPPTSASHQRHRLRLLAAAAVILLAVATAVVSIAPAREAVADWLGIGAVEVRRSDQPPATSGVPANAVPGKPGAPRDRAAAARLADAQRVVAFPIALPSDTSAGSLDRVEVDRRVAGGLVALDFGRFTLVEIASYEGGGSALGKSVEPGVQIDHVTVRGAPGLWIEGAHAIAYLDRSGAFATDTVRRSGPVLVWDRAGVTYRIEGFDRRADAERMAESVR